jgi:hypothetical protein
MYNVFIFINENIICKIQCKMELKREIYIILGITHRNTIWHY